MVSNGNQEWVLLELHSYRNGPLSYTQLGIPTGFTPYSRQMGSAHSDTGTVSVWSDNIRGLLVYWSLVRYLISGSRFGLPGRG